MKRSRGLIILLLFQILESLWSTCAFAALVVHAPCSPPACVHMYMYALVLVPPFIERLC